MLDPNHFVDRCLVVANFTLDDLSLNGLIRTRFERDYAEVHLLVPIVRSDSFRINLRAWSMAASAGIVPLWNVGLDVDGEFSARRSLDAALERFRGFGSRVDGEIAHVTPVVAIRAVLARRSFDEIIISTPPTGVSGWLRLDLPSRVRRQFGIPVTHVCANSFVAAT